MHRLASSMLGLGLGFGFGFGFGLGLVERLGVLALLHLVERDLRLHRPAVLRRHERQLRARRVGEPRGAVLARLARSVAWRRKPEECTVKNVSFLERKAHLRRATTAGPHTQHKRVST